MLLNKIRFVVNNHMYKVQPHVYKKKLIYGCFITTFAADKSVQSVLLEDAGCNCEFHTRMVFIKVNLHFFQLFVLVTLTLCVCVTNASSGIAVRIVA